MQLSNQTLQLKALGVHEPPEVARDISHVRLSQGKDVSAFISISKGPCDAETHRSDFKSSQGRGRVVSF